MYTKTALSISLVRLKHISSILKNQLYLYILAMNNLKMKYEKIPFTIASQIIKCLEINLPKEGQIFCTENYNLSLKKIKEDLSKGKNSHIYELEDLMLLRW